MTNSIGLSTMGQARGAFVILFLCLLSAPEWGQGSVLKLNEATSAEKNSPVRNHRSVHEPKEASHGLQYSSTESSTDSDDDHHGDDHHGDEHHGVHLASWRWDEYSNIVTFLVMVIIAAVLKILFHHCHTLHKHVPESCVLIIVGMVFGSIVYYGLESHSHHFPTFTSELFFNVLLPPIILDAAYSLYDRDFLANLGSILLFAVVGTLFNVFAIGFLLYGIYQLGWMGSFSAPLDAINCLVFSSLIAAVDPVAVLAIFEEIGVNMNLYFLVFGESLLNDGITVVLYNAMVALAGMEVIAYIEYVMAFLSFFTVVFGGLFVGIAMGAMSAYILKFTTETRVIEPLIVFACAYLAFILAETIHWSGIISLIGCGIMQKRYAFLNISQKTYTTVKYGIKTIASVSDCIIFLFLGIVTISHEKEWHLGFVLWTVLLCTIVRFSGVYFLSWLINKRRIKDISYREQFIMAYGGLRGAVGFSLVTILPDTADFKDIFLTTTLVMIFFTCFVQGSSIKFFVNKLKITRKSTDKKKTISKDINEKTIDHVMAGIEGVTGEHRTNFILERIRHFDDKYIKIFLIRKDAEDLLTLKVQKITLAEHYTRLYGPAVHIHNRQSLGPLEHPEDEKPAAKPEINVKPYSSSELKALRRAMEDTPFARYRKRAYTKNTTEQLHAQMTKERENRNKLLEQSLLRPRARTLSGVDYRRAGDADRTTANEEAGERSRLLWKRGLDANRIRQTYQEAKGEFKNRTSMLSGTEIPIIVEESSVDRRQQCGDATDEGSGSNAETTL